MSRRRGRARLYTEPGGTDAMKMTSLDGFSTQEIALNDRLNALFQDWHDALKRRGVWDKYDSESFVTDGIYPGYLSQKKKILFIAKEALDIAGQSYIDIFYHAIRMKSVGDKPINRHGFYRKLLKIAYGLTHGCPDWEEIPPASVLAEDFGSERGLSFAFMNVSKLSHEYADNASWTADASMIDDFARESAATGERFFHKQMEIMAPDSIITMNIAPYYPFMGDIVLKEALPNVEIYSMNLGAMNIPVFDCWHFAAPKSDRDRYYEPLCSAWKRVSAG